MESVCSTPEANTVSQLETQAANVLSSSVPVCALGDSRHTVYSHLGLGGEQQQERLFKNYRLLTIPGLPQGLIW